MVKINKDQCILNVNQMMFISLKTLKNFRKQVQSDRKKVVNKFSRLKPSDIWDICLIYVGVKSSNENSIPTSHGLYFVVRFLFVVQQTMMFNPILSHTTMNLRVFPTI